MKQRAISIALVLVSLASVGASLFVFAPQTTYAYNSPSPNPASTTWCTSQYGSSTGTESTNVVEPLCEIGFMAPANKTSESTACGAANNYSQAEEAACEAGYNYARNLLQVCGSYPNNTSACHTGFINAGDSSGADACQYSSTISVAACSAGYAAGGGSTINTPPSSTTPSSNDSDLTCEADAGSLGWIICAVVRGVNNLENFIVKNILDKYLDTPAINFNSCGSGSPTKSNPCDPDNIYAIWSSFRTYGDIVLVIALLVVVFGEAIGGGLIDAYTAKKILPRILIAAILINLSIYIVAVGIDISNVLGSGIQTLITDPLGSANHGLSLKFSGGLGVAGLAAIFVGGASLFAGGLPGIEFIALTLLLPLLLASIGVIVTLLIRRALIVFLVFISPIAFALYVLPNTEQYFKKWWDVLFKTLLIYPIVGVLFGMSTVMGVILNAQATPVAGASTTNQVLGQVMSIIALVIPLFLIPFSFRFAGGVIGTIHEQVENHRKRAHGMIAGDAKNPNSLQSRLKAKAGLNRGERNMTAAGIGTRLNVGNAFRGKYRRSLAVRRETARKTGGAAYLEGDATHQSNQGDENYLMAVANRGLAERKLKETTQRRDGETDVTKKAALSQEVIARQRGLDAASQVHSSKATQMAAAQAWAASGLGISAGKEGYNEIADTMAKITGGRGTAAYVNAMNSSQFALKNAGRYDLGGINNGAGYNYDGGIDRSSGYTAGNAKKQTFIAGAEQHLGVNVQSQNGETGEAHEIARSLSDKLASGELTGQGVKDYHAVLLEASQSPLTGNKKEIEKQLVAINMLGTGSYTAPSGSDGETRILEAMTGRDNNNATQRSRRIDPNTIEDH